MKVLHVIDNLAVGGAEKLVVDLVEEHSKSNIASQIYLLDNSTSFLQKRAEGLCKIWAPLKDMRNPLHIWHILNILRREDIKLIHVHLFPAQLWVALAKLVHILLNRPLIIITTEHNTKNRRRKLFFFRLLDKWMYSSYDSVVAISEGASISLHQWIGTKGKITTIYNGIDTKRYSRNCDSAKQVDNKFRLITIGSIEQQKNQIEIVKAIEKLDDVYLTIVGEGSLRSEISKYINDHSLFDRVKMVGIKENIPEILWSNDLYIQSSIYEGFGIAVLEAMAASLPVITTNVPGLREIVSGFGVTYESGNVNELEEKILNMMHNRKFRDEIAAKCLERSANFSIEQTANKYSQLYTNELNSKDIL